jgi:hypothetical protein
VKRSSCGSSATTANGRPAFDALLLRAGQSANAQLTATSQVPLRVQVPDMSQHKGWTRQGESVTVAIQDSLVENAMSVRGRVVVVVALAGVLGTDQNDPALVLGYAFAVGGWLGALGFFRYPSYRLRGEEPSAYAEERSGEGVRRFFEVSTDHKVVGIQYLVGSLAIFLIAGTNAMLIRTQLLSAVSGP